MTAPFTVLTVCVGNVCRSPLAERLLRLRLAEHVDQGRLVVESAGVGAVVGHPVEALAAAELHRLGGSAEGFAARQLAPAYVGQADLVLAATVDVRTRVLREEPRALRRTFTLAELAAICASADLPALATLRDLVAFAAANRGLAAGADLDVPDPIGRGPAEHQAVADMIDRHVTAIAARLGPLLAGPAGP